ncbi:MAG TPA: prolipoprotein diacylglyceryl transferase family protein [Polyangiaceae bacterium]|nr:prolipoprotein diacylglyceryl transferase family protein [Polyangiaceae bacterium]
MLEPRVPFLTLPELPILPDLGGTGPVTLKPFGALVALGIFVGWRIASRQAQRLGMPSGLFGSFGTWVLAGGFVGGHVFDVLFYRPDLLRAPAADVAKTLLTVWGSQSSFGGFLGASLGMLGWKYWHDVADALPYCDTVASAFPVGWAFGRAGCAIAHDHPGALSDAWFAVQYPDGGRFDLGLYEMALTIPLALAFRAFRREPRPWGFYLGAMCSYYAPVRFCLDFLRARDVRGADARYAGLTPAQWLCAGLLAVGVAFFVRARRAARRDDVPRYHPGMAA